MRVMVGISAGVAGRIEGSGMHAGYRGFQLICTGVSTSCPGLTGLTRASSVLRRDGLPGHQGVYARLRRAMPGNDDGEILRSWKNAPAQKRSAPAHRRGAPKFKSVALPSAAVADEAQHEQEQVDVVEIERERAHHGFAAGDGAVILHVVHFLDLLGI